ncbi:unnamed protein product [Adineta steineri]|nr:unnamed protein product [Adineta steineri]
MQRSLPNPQLPLNIQPMETTPYPQGACYGNKCSIQRPVSNPQVPPNIQPMEDTCSQKKCYRNKCSTKRILPNPQIQQDSLKNVDLSNTQ